MPMQRRREMGAALRVRLARLWWEWPIACTLICEIVMILVGVAFVVVGTYAALYRERMAGIIPTMLFVGIALPASIADFNIIGIIFYGLFLIGGIEEARTRYERARLRKQWVVHVKRGGP